MGKKGTSHCREQFVDSLKTKNRVIIWSCRGFPDSSAGKEFACNAGDPGSIPGLGRSPREGIGYPPVFLRFPCGSAGKESICHMGDLGSIPGLGRSPGEGKGYPFQYSGLENSMGLHGYSPWGRKSWTWLSNFPFHQPVGGILLEFAPGKSALGQEHLDFRHKCPCHHCTLKSLASALYLWGDFGWLWEHKLESRLLGEISITSGMQMTPPLWQKVKN